MLSLGRNLREYAESKFKRDGVKVKGNSKITAVGPDWLELEGEGRGKLSCPPREAIEVF
jgi:NADH dehydrogenase FAD-containing subunit